MMILFGGTQDGGGLGLTPGGKPIPIDPWGPLSKCQPKRSRERFVRPAGRVLQGPLHKLGVSGDADLPAG